MPTLLPHSSIRLLQLALETQQRCLGPMCICLTYEEGATLRRIGKIVRKWKRQARQKPAPKAAESA